MRDFTSVCLALALLGGCADGGSRAAALPGMVIAAGPVTSNVGTAFPSDIVVAMQDGTGNVDATFTADVILSIESNPAGGTLLGTTTVTAVAGQATFSGLSIDRLGTGYTLRATSGGHSAVSAPFDIITNAVIAGTLTTDTTFVSASINWEFTGDQNQNATSSVRFRRAGTSAWEEALDLTRVLINGGFDRSVFPHVDRDVNSLSGSIFGLSTGTTYDLALTISDPDGGGANVVATFTTRSMPTPGSGRIIEVRDTDNLSTLHANAVAGDTYRFHAGNYNGGSRWDITTSGDPDEPILFTAFGDGAVNFSGLDIWGSHVWIDGFSIGTGGIHGRLGGVPQPTGVVVTRNTVSGVGGSKVHCVDADGADWFVSDNVLVGNYTVPFPPVGELRFSGEGIEFGGIGRGSVAAFNDISFTADGISYGHGNLDVHNNVIHQTAADYIEMDFSWDNYRAWGNRLWGNDHTHAFSAQPIQGGPWYIVRNQLSGQGGIFKYGTGGRPFSYGARIVVSNSFAVASHATSFSRVVESPQSIFANNFFAVRKAGIAAIGNDTGGSLPRPAPTKFWDNNRYECSPSNVFYFAGWHTLGAMRSVFQVDFNTTLVTAEDVVTNVPVNFFEGTTKAMMPIAGRALIDSGASSSQLTGLENLLGPHLGSAPDVGAYELGLGEAWVGPRAFTDRLAYGVPSGWSVASLASLGGYADLGAPGSVSDGRLLLVSSSPRAFLVVSFEPAAGESRWTRYEDLLDGNAGDTMLVGPARFRQGLAGSIVRRGANANLLGCRVDDNGVLKILGGTASGDLGAVQNEMFTFLRSLYYSWTLSN